MTDTIEQIVNDHADEVRAREDHWEKDVISQPAGVMENGRINRPAAGCPSCSNRTPTGAEWLLSRVRAVPPRPFHYLWKHQCYQGDRGVGRDP